MFRKFLKLFFPLFLIIAVLGICSGLSGGESLPQCKDGVCTFNPDEGGSPVTLSVETDGLVIARVPFGITVKALDKDGSLMEDFNQPLSISAEKGSLMMEGDDKKHIPAAITGEFIKGSLRIEKLVIEKGGSNRIILSGGAVHGEKALRVIPGVLSILPPLLAIILALTLRQVVVSLFLGVWLGAVFIYDYNPFTALLRVVDTILIKAIADPDHVSIIVFSLFLGGMVAVISRSGGSQGMVDIIKKYAKDPQSGQIATWALGLFIFFDDYANTLIVGNSMRPLTDKLKISREKLSFLVDATAAPVTNIAIISTWIGFEIGVIGDSLKTAGISREPYMVFIQTIPYRFYPILLLVFVFLLAWLSRDFGPMLKAEMRARSTGQLLAPGARPLSSIGMGSVGGDDRHAPRRWYNAVVPIVSVILLTLLGLWYSGTQGLIKAGGHEALNNVKIYQLLDKANSFHVLLWASLGGSFIAIGMVLAQRILKLEEAVSTWIEGAKSLIPAVIILSLAWSVGSICKDLNTGGYLALLSRGNISPNLLPVLIFILSSIISFATGTSWGTMSIVMPIAVHLGVHLPPETMAEAMKNTILLGSVSGVLAGATFGDHCSPISDTTIMSSMASGADHVDHVRTQLPYALTVGIIGTLLGTLPAGYGMNPYIGLIIGTALIFLILKFYGKNPSKAAGVPVPRIDREEEDSGADGGSADK